MENIVKLKEVPSPPNEKKVFKTIIIGTSDCNLFTPVYSLFNHKLLMLGEIRVLEYSLPCLTSGMYSPISRQYNDLLLLLREGDDPQYYVFKNGGEEHTLQVMRGLLCDREGKILLCLGINGEYLLNTPIQEIIETPDSTQFSLFVSHEFNSNPIYKNVKKKLGAMYFDPCTEKNLDIVFTAEPKDWLFKNNHSIPSFDTVSKMKKHLNKDIPRSLIQE